MKRKTFFLTGISLILLVGCSPSSDTAARAKAPRAVATVQLAPVRPEHRQTMTGAVDSWKTEKIGFEVSGRVVQVLEPNAEVEARVVDPENQEFLSRGTVLARLDDKRYRIAEVTAEAALDVPRRRLDAIQIEIDQGIPARQLAAEAEEKRAHDEFDRLSRLLERNAVSQSDFDRARTALETAQANVATVQAELAAKQAEYRAVAAQVDQAKLQLEKARLDRRDTMLYSSLSTRPPAAMSCGGSSR